MKLSRVKTINGENRLRVGFIGLGVMGAPMAGHLAKAGHTVVVYNRTHRKAEDWCIAHSGLSVMSASSPREAAQEADIVFSCVGNDDDLRAITLGTEGAFHGMRAGSIFADHTTTSAEVAREIGQQARLLGLEFLDAPVSGGQAGAVNGTLTVMVGGEAPAFEQMKPVAMAFSRAVTRIGPQGCGQLAKMVNQICVAGVIQGLSEGIAFGVHAGIDMELVLEVISKGAAQSWQMENRGRTMVEGQFDFGFAVDLMRKDLGLCLEESRRNGSTLPVTSLLDQFYADVQRMGGQRWDTSSLIKRLL